MRMRYSLVKVPDGIYQVENSDACNDKAGDDCSPPASYR